jgi:cytochrome c5
MALFILARYMANRTQMEWVRQSPEDAAQVEERLKPLGSVRLPGETSAAAAPALAAEVAAPVAAPLSGPQVYNAACNACHGGGIGGAPVTGDKAAWGPRIAQGPVTLRDHAINGFQGSTGVMPPKGGRVDLSDQEIIAAVDYMVSQSR